MSNFEKHRNIIYFKNRVFWLNKEDFEIIQTKSRSKTSFIRELKKLGRGDIVEKIEKAKQKGQFLFKNITRKLSPESRDYGINEFREINRLSAFPEEFYQVFDPNIALIHLVQKIKKFKYDKLELKCGCIVDTRRIKRKECNSKNCCILELKESLVKGVEISELFIRAEVDESVAVLCYKKKNKKEWVYIVFVINEVASFINESVCLHVDIQDNKILKVHNQGEEIVLEVEELPLRIQTTINFNKYGNTTKINKRNFAKLDTKTQKHFIEVAKKFGVDIIKEMMLI